jgi:lysophospholipid acyltransferase (LPLAT)-like uncharacterized protein
MKVRSPWVVRLLGLVGACLVCLWRGLVGVRLDVRASGPQPTDPRRQRCIYAFWHESILMASTVRSRLHILISQHADGELISQTCRHLRIGAVRGSTTRGGGQGLLDLLRCPENSHLAVTPDGPRGPRRRVQMGLIFLASRTGLPIVGFGVGYSHAWRAPSWDRFAVPWPGSTAYCVVAAPLVVPPRLDRRGMERYRLLVEGQLLAATEAAERWARTGQRPPPLACPVAGAPGLCGPVAGAPGLCGPKEAQEHKPQAPARGSELRVSA